MIGHKDIALSGFQILAALDRNREKKDAYQTPSPQFTRRKSKPTAKTNHTAQTRKNKRKESGEEEKRTNHQDLIQSIEKGSHRGFRKRGEGKATSFSWNKCWTSVEEKVPLHLPSKGRDFLRKTQNKQHKKGGNVQKQIQDIGLLKTTSHSPPNKIGENKKKFRVCWNNLGTCCERVCGNQKRLEYDEIFTTHTSVTRSFCFYHHGCHQKTQTPICQ